MASSTALLENGTWYLATSDASKLYVYPDLQQLQENRPEVTDSLPHYDWYSVILLDSAGQPYEILLGLPKIQQPSIIAMRKSLAEHATDLAPLQLDRFPGLLTLLQSRFCQST